MNPETNNLHALKSSIIIASIQVYFKTMWLKSTVYNTINAEYLFVAGIKIKHKNIYWKRW